MSRGRQPSLYLQFLLFVLAGWANRHQQAVIEDLQAENQSLREQLGNKRLRWTDAQRRRLAEKAKAIGRSALAALGTVVTPDTLLRWYRNLVAAKYDGSKARGPGRPPTKQDIAKRVIGMATENPAWGYTRISGALFNLGHDIARNTIKAILQDRGIEPAPERGRRTSWDTFIKSHLGAIAELSSTGRMMLSAEQILDQIRALSPAERLYVVERIVHDVAAEVTPASPVVTVSGRLLATLSALEPLDEELADVDETRVHLDEIDL